MSINERAIQAALEARRRAAAVLPDPGIEEARQKLLEHIPNWFSTMGITNQPPLRDVNVWQTENDGRPGGFHASAKWELEGFEYTARWSGSFAVTMDFGGRGPSTVSVRTPEELGEALLWYQRLMGE
jgi:hypothetical protein